MKNSTFSRWCLMALMLLALPLAAMAQNVGFAFKGAVIDGDGQPVAGATIQLVGTNSVTLTDFDGKYMLKGSAKSGKYILQATFIGYAAGQQSVEVNAEEKTVDFTLNNDALGLDEVVVTGNSTTTTRKQLGTQISVVRNEQIRDAGATNTLAALQGKVMGAQITQNSGDPAGGMSVRLRGAGSVNSSSDPLYIVDGVIVDNSSQNVINRNADAMATSFSAGQNRLVDLNPNDIDRVEVLNGAAAAAIYGARASNGVIQIFTKRGKSGKMKINFSSAVMNSSLRKEVAMTTYGKRFGVKGNSDLTLESDRLTMTQILGYNVAGNNPFGLAAANSAALISGFNSRNIGYALAGNAVTAAGGIDTNRRRILIKDQYDVTRYNYWDDIFANAMGTDNNISFTGGSDNVQYAASFGYFDNDGILKNTNFKKYTGRLNLDMTLNDWARLSTGLAFTSSRSKDMPNGNNFFNPISGIFIIDNVWDLNRRDANGNLMAVERQRVNPLSMIETFDITQRTNRITANTKLSLNPLKGLTIDAIVGADMYSLVGNEYRPRLPYFVAATPNVADGFFPDGYLSYGQADVRLINHDLNVNYMFNITPDLVSTTTAGYQNQYERRTFYAAVGRNFLAQPLGKPVINGATNLFERPTQSFAERQLFGAFVQETFAWKEQLFVTGALRFDQSSLFGTNKNQVFPKVSGSWVFSELLKNTGIEKVLSSGKIRAAYGEAGNVTGIGFYDRYEVYGSGAVNGLSSWNPARTLPNVNVAPERSREIEFGGDFSFLKNRLGLSFTVYNRKVTDLLLTKAAAPTVGYTSVLTNESADSTYLSNRGFELKLDATIIKTQNFKWDATVIYNTNQNTVYGIPGGFISLRGGDGTQSAITGQPFGVFYGRYYARNADGSLLLTSQGLPQPARGTQPYVAAPGTPVLVNDGTRTDNGQPDQRGTVELRKVLGNPNPDWTGSLASSVSYKRASLSFLFDAFMGASIYNWNRITANNVGWGPLAERELKGEVPRGYTTAIAGGITGSRIQEDHVESADYVKLREIALSYNFGKVKGLENISFSLIGRNLISWDNYTGFDPETNSAGQSDRVRGDDFGAVPIPRQFTARLSIDF